MLILLLIGCAVGLSAGMFGIGGALIATPMLKVFAGLSAFYALASPLPASLPTALSGSIAYSRSGLVRFRVVSRILLIALPANILASYYTKFIPSQYLMIATGVVMVYVSISFLLRAIFMKEVAPQEAVQPSLLISLIVGGVAGTLSGMLAIGGGIILVPAFLRFLHMPLKQALATSLICVVALAIPGTIVHAQLGHIDWQVALILTISSVPCSFIGARLALRLRNQTLERIYGVFMLALTIQFFWNLLQ